MELLEKLLMLISDVIYYALLGQKGSFNTRLSFVTVNEEKNGKANISSQNFRLGWYE